MISLDFVTQKIMHGFLTLVVSVFIVLMISTVALADPPATVASCEGIEDAYPILGKKCAKEYSKINHAPGNAKERLKTFKARVAVLQIFRKALVCNGLYGASKSDQQRFISGEENHLIALANLRNSMVLAGDPVIPAAYTVDDLNKITMKKQQCK